MNERLLVAVGQPKPAVPGSANPGRQGREGEGPLWVEAGGAAPTQRLLQRRPVLDAANRIIRC